MGRQKKIKTVQAIVNNPEVNMSETAVLDEPAVLENLQTEIDLARIELEKTRLEIEEKKKELNYSHLRDTDEAEKKVIDRHVIATSAKSAGAADIARQKAYDKVMLTGRFHHRYKPGGKEKLPYMKYEDDPVKWYTFVDGETYTIPRGFVEQIKEYYHKPIFSQKEGVMDPENPGSVIAGVDKKNKRYDFVPVGF